MKWCTYRATRLRGWPRNCRDSQNLVTSPENLFWTAKCVVRLTAFPTLPVMRMCVCGGGGGDFALSSPPPPPFSVYLRPPSLLRSPLSPPPSPSFPEKCWKLAPSTLNANITVQPNVMFQLNLCAAWPTISPVFSPSPTSFFVLNIGHPFFGLYWSVDHVLFLCIYLLVRWISLMIIVHIMTKYILKTVFNGM